MATFTNINAQENYNLIQKLNKMEDSKSDSYKIYKQINYSLSNSFIHKEIPSFSSIIPPVKQNLKSQAEELNKLQCEVLSLEEKVRELEVSKKLKLVKIEDLRKIIQRIADEESFDCVFTTRPNCKFTPREKLSSCISSRRSKDNRCTQQEVGSTSTQDGSEATAEEGESEGAKRGINCCSCCKLYYLCKDLHHCTMPDVLQQSLLYWQENLSAPKKLFKA